MSKRHFITKARPDRWKLLRMLHYENANDNCESLQISDRQFNDFAARHRHLNPVVENREDMVNSYIVVAPQGGIITNSSIRFEMTNSLVDHPFNAEFAKVSFSEAAFQKRYREVV